MRKLVISLSLALASLQSASAITFDVYNGSQGNIVGGVFTYTAGSLTLTGNGYQSLTPTPINLVTSAPVSRNSSAQNGSGGLGVNGSGGSSDVIDLNSTGLGEGLVLNFGGATVQLVSVSFAGVGTGDDLDFAFGNGANPTGSYLLSGMDLNGLPAVNQTRVWDASAANYVGTHFLFSSIQSPGETSEDTFRIASITVNVVPARGVPDAGSSVALLGLGLVGMAAIRRFLS